MGSDYSRPVQVNRNWGPSYYLQQCGGGMQCLCPHAHRQRRYVYHDPYGMGQTYDPVEYIMNGGQMPRHFADPGQWTLRDIETMGGIFREVQDRMEWGLLRNGRGGQFGGGYGPMDMYRIGDIVREHDRRIYNLEDGRDLYRNLMLGGGLMGGPAIAVAQGGGGLNYIGGIGGNIPLGLYNVNPYFDRNRGDTDNRRQNDNQGSGQGQGSRGNNGGQGGQNNRREHEPLLVNMNNVRIGSFNDLENEFVYPVIVDQDRLQNRGQIYGRRVHFNDYNDFTPYRRFG